ncbi:hypothetical protein UG54_07380 [Gordonia sihwensis]|nr:hypothetical protein UG54_07380 [Gordonia sihwensis]
MITLLTIRIQMGEQPVTDLAQIIRIQPGRRVGQLRLGTGFDLRRDTAGHFRQNARDHQRVFGADSPGRDRGGGGGLPGRQRLPLEVGELADRLSHPQPSTRFAGSEPQAL